MIAHDPEHPKVAQPGRGSVNGTHKANGNGTSALTGEHSSLARSSSILLDAPGSVGLVGDTDHDHQIPDIVIRRLPIYVRTLRALTDSNVESVSSEELADLIGVTAAQIRRDLSYFGKFGKQGKGYDTQFLAHTISRILRLDRQWPVALVGLGNLGRAIANYRGFTPSSFS
ncbi:MAG TPA: redox-sensing transcriptional repressor Rex, partial [Thermomicrobiales bacterium]|nr:redox-sensing transcriptional repressor Rex [Thermomicrobiales bacterium]